MSYGVTVGVWFAQGQVEIIVIFNLLHQFSFLSVKS